MNGERWKQIDAVLDAVLERAPEHRAEFLASLCGSDEGLRREVEELLSALERSGDFIETPAIALAAKNFADGRVAANVGRKVGGYEIRRLLGAGGMGEVYLARDAKLGRNVALKILPEHFGGDAERVRRFGREAQAVSALNHPNIVTIFDVGADAGTSFIATEYVEGRTLREVLNGGKSPPLEVLKSAAQVCEALEAAHEAGIVHRDIKPENIMLRPDGWVKVLDFGLAKQAAPGGTKFSETGSGVVVGTLNYLSPEQALGRPLDRRTDLWSLGVCLYELLTGRPPFAGETQAAVFDQILNKAPRPPTELNSGLPDEFDRVIAKALEKDPDLRYQTARDFRADLRRLIKALDSAATFSGEQARPTSGSGRPRRGLSFSRALPSAALIVVAVSSFAGWRYWRGAPAPPEWSRARHVQLTEQGGTEFFPTLAPDGRSFVYAARGDDDFDLFAQRVGGRNPVNLTKDSAADDTMPAFSPDGERIAFRSEREPRGIYVMGASGENPRRVSEVGYHPSWSPDGRALVVSEGGREIPDVASTGRPSALWVVNVETGARRELIRNEAFQPAWSPKGKRIAFWFIRRNAVRSVATVSAEGGEPVVLPSDNVTSWNPVWAPDGRHLYFVSDRGGNMGIWRVAIDEATGKFLGEPESVPTPAKLSRHLNLSRDGRRLIYVQTENRSNIQIADFDQKAERMVGEPVWVTTGDREISRPELSPDGTRFVMRLIRRTHEDIVTVSRDGSDWRDITNDPYFDRYVRWSPDGKTIAFGSSRTGQGALFFCDADGTNLRRVSKEPGPTFPSFSPDGRRLAFVNGQQSYVYELAKEWGPGAIKPLPRMPDGEYLTVWDWSPDGKKLAGTFDGAGALSVGYYSFETGTYEKLGEVPSHVQPMWLPDSRRFVFTEGGKAFITDIKARRTRELLSRPPDLIRNVAVSRDGKYLYFTLQTSQSDIWLLDLS